MKAEISPNFPTLLDTVTVSGHRVTKLTVHNGTKLRIHGYLWLPEPIGIVVQMWEKDGTHEGGNKKWDIVLTDFNRETLERIRAQGPVKEGGPE